MAQHAPGWQHDAGPDVEYKLSREYRRPTLMLFIFMVVLSAACESVRSPVTPPWPWTSATSAWVLVKAGAPIFGALAVYFGVSYLWQLRFRTRVTSQGIEIRGYFNHFVPWDQVHDIEAAGLGRDRIDDGSYIPPVARITVVRVSGRKVRLRAPMVTRWAADPYFDDKVRQLQRLWMQYGRRVIAG